MAKPGSESRITEGEQARNFILAGNARVTLVSEKTGTRFTYRLRQKEDTRPGSQPGSRTPHFVSVLTGPDNESAYEFVGTIFDRQTYSHSRKARIAVTAPSIQAFLYAWNYLVSGRMPPQVEVWHEGRCGRCGRALTVPSSLLIGLGPECAGR